MKPLLLTPLLICLHFYAKCQSFNCTFKEPTVTINFGSGPIGDRASGSIYNYRYVPYSCPSDGHYTYASSTVNCFRGDWINLPEDHTEGDAEGNMLIVNASYSGGAFFTTNISRLKPATTYEFSVWMLNVCRPTEKCPYPLLPDINIVLGTPEGRVQAQFTTGELIRRNEPQWTRFQVIFTTPATEMPLTLTMVDNNPGGCGNDFAMDDLVFRECIIVPPPITKKTVTPNKKETAKKVVTPVKKPVPATLVPVVAKADPPPVPKTVVVAKAEPKPVPPPKKTEVVTKPPVIAKAEPKPPIKKPEPVKTPVRRETPAIAKNTAPPVVEKRDPQTATVSGPKAPDTVQAIKPRPITLPPPPALISGRSNPLIKLIEMPAGEIKIDIYDNGLIDGDTVSVYHNNRLMVSHAKLSTTALTFRIKIDASDPHHEIVLVAHNLGSIPPNTSLMVVNAGSKRYEVFISSTEQKNAKVVFDYKE